MNSAVKIIFGILLILIGVAVMAVTQVVLHEKMKEFNAEWGEKK